ncbi:hypothetical protein BJ085DRAFT_33169 [Dimargaris cristalligena]|uniref:Uncharacterized protein n=1 Tax=Dimargaris cristalligena TaxID=215637 RepID=A0A4V1J5F7_9FUNG|nr:hypothetical protein BJ085DRAFT_33169 [Dimargaris cristalligena]|eukprot:RKP38899.1 hypothetical protein BJ085DRAFT_33169 [Dimargaris cristalligena]
MKLTQTAAVALIFIVAASKASPVPGKTPLVDNSVVVSFPTGSVQPPVSNVRSNIEPNGFEQSACVGLPQVALEWGEREDNLADLMHDALDQTADTDAIQKFETALEEARLLDLLTIVDEEFRAQLAEAAKGPYAVTTLDFRAKARFPDRALIIQHFPLVKALHQGRAQWVAQYLQRLLGAVYGEPSTNLEEELQRDVRMPQPGISYLDQMKRIEQTTSAPLSAIIQQSLEQLVDRVWGEVNFVTDILVEGQALTVDGTVGTEIMPSESIDLPFLGFKRALPEFDHQVGC